MIMEPVERGALDLIVAAAEDKALMDDFRTAKSAGDLQKRWQKRRPDYSFTDTDCEKLFDKQVEILEALKTYNEKGFY
jgi:hypothetical protein